MQKSVDSPRTVILVVPFLPRGGTDIYQKLSDEQRTDFASKLDGECITCVARTASSVRYMALEEDDDSETFQPIVGWSIPPATFPNISPSEISFELIDDVVIYIFQNDLAIVVMKVKTGFNIARDDMQGLKNIDVATSSYSREVVNFINSQLGDHYMIDDISHWGLSTPGMLWCSRIFVVQKNEIAETLFQNLGVEDQVSLPLDHALYFVGEGNSFIAEQDNIKIEKFLKVFNIAQLYFAYNDQVCKLFKNVYESAFSIGTGPKIDSLHRRCNRYSTSLSIFHIAFDDAKRGLQGKRKKILHHIIEQWDLHGLQNSALAHSEFATTFINGIVAERARRNQSTIEAGVVFLAGVSILQFFLDFWQYSQAKFDKDPFRFMYFARSVSVEFVIVGAAVILFALAYAQKSVK